VTETLFPRVAVIGIGLIGSSLALAMRAHGLAATIVCGDTDKMNVGKAIELEIVDGGSRNNAEAVKDADLVVLATPVGALSKVAAEIAPYLKKGCVVIDVGSVKESVAKAIAPCIPEGVAFIPCHPIAGTEYSGPEAGFAELFQGKWCILTPPAGADDVALEKVRRLWTLCGARAVCLSPEEHDRVLATVSHVPHMLAFTIMGTADDLAKDIGQDVIGYAGSSFRDFTRVAASDPIMWRDIFLNNRDAVLEILGRLKKDLDKLEAAVSKGDGAAMEAIFTRSRDLRRALAKPRLVEPPVIAEGL